MDILMFVVSIVLLICLACFFIFVLHMEDGTNVVAPCTMLVIAMVIVGGIAFYKASRYGEKEAHKLIAAGTPSYELVSNKDGSKTWERVKVKK